MQSRLGGLSDGFDFARMVRVEVNTVEGGSQVLSIFTVQITQHKSQVECYSSFEFNVQLSFSPSSSFPSSTRLRLPFRPILVTSRTDIRPSESIRVLLIYVGGHRLICSKSLGFEEAVE